MHVVASVADTIPRQARVFEASGRRLWWNAAPMAAYLSL